MKLWAGNEQEVALAMASTNKLTRAVFLTLIALGATVGSARLLQGANQDKQEGSGKQSADKQGNGAKQDKKDNAKDKGKGGPATLIVTVLNEQQAPLKGALVELLTDSSKEQQTTGDTGKLEFQPRGDRLTVRVVADHMDPYQKQWDQKDFPLQVVMKKSN
jgi:hypothetical protein